MLHAYGHLTLAAGRFESSRLSLASILALQQTSDAVRDELKLKFAADRTFIYEASGRVEYTESLVHPPAAHAHDVDQVARRSSRGSPDGCNKQAEATSSVPPTKRARQNAGRGCGGGGGGDGGGDGGDKTAGDCEAAVRRRR